MNISCAAITLNTFKSGEFFQDVRNFNSSFSRADLGEGEKEEDDE